MIFEFCNVRNPGGILFHVGLRWMNMDYITCFSSWSDLVVVDRNYRKDREQPGKQHHKLCKSEIGWHSFRVQTIPVTGL